MDAYKSGDFGTTMCLLSETLQLAKNGKLIPSDRQILADISEACRIAG